MASACQGPGAPLGQGVCWLKDKGAFTAVARGVDTLDDCAAELEAIHLQRRSDVEGGYQGSLIYATAASIGSTEHEGDFAYPIFQPGQRAAIDRDLATLIRARGGALPSAADIAVVRK